MVKFVKTMPLRPDVGASCIKAEKRSPRSANVRTMTPSAVVLPRRHAGLFSCELVVTRKLSSTLRRRPAPEHCSDSPRLRGHVKNQALPAGSPPVASHSSQVQLRVANNSPARRCRYMQTYPARKVTSNSNFNSTLRLLTATLHLHPQDLKTWPSPLPAGRGTACACDLQPS